MWIWRYFFGVDTAPVSRHKSIACSCEEFELRQEIQQGGGEEIT